MITIVVVSGDSETVVNLRDKLDNQEDFNVVGCGKDAYEALKLAETRKPNVMLIDIGAPGDNIVEIASLIKRRCPSTNIIIHNISDDSLAQKAFCGGFSGYLRKNTTPELLYSSIRTVFQGGCLVPHEIADKLHTVFSMKTEFQDSEKPVLPETISNTELRIMKSLKHGLDTKNIAARLGLREGTVRNHTSSLIHKTNLKNRTEVALYALKAGL